MERFEIAPRGPFTLASAARFIAGWPPAARAEAADGAVRLGFLVDDWSGHAGVRLEQQDEHGPVSVTVTASTAADLERVRDQAARIVSLDHDGAPYAAVGERDPVVGELARSAGWLRPVLFHSPYEAACWAVISTRLRHTQAARVRDGLAQAHGAVLEEDGLELPGFPAPERLLAVTDAPGLPEAKLVRLRGIARAAVEGRLDRERLLAAPPEEALAELRELPGIGPFWAEAILLRAVGTTDVLPRVEPRVREAVARRYGAPEVVEDPAALAARAEGWRPCRTWVAVLLRAAG